MKKQHLMLSTVAMLALRLGGTAHAEKSCQPTPQGNLCTAQVDFQQFATQAFMSQLQSQWCWAASISMIYSFYDHPVAQARIVSDVYGTPENFPASSGTVIARELSRCWVDDFGMTFQSRITGAYDFDAGVAAISNAQIVSELTLGRPLLYGNRTHAMVLTAVQYYETPGQPNIVAAGVFDPWPGIGARGLSNAELVPMHQGGELRFLATVSTTATACTPGGVPPGPGPNEPYDPGGCAIASPSSSVLLALAFVFLRRRRKAARRH